MKNDKPFAMFFNASPRKGWNTAKMLEAAAARALGKRLVEKASGEEYPTSIKR